MATEHYAARFVVDKMRISSPRSKQQHTHYHHCIIHALRAGRKKKTKREIRPPLQSTRACLYWSIAMCTCTPHHTHTHNYRCESCDVPWSRAVHAHSHRYARTCKSVSPQKQTERKRERDTHKIFCSPLTHSHLWARS